MVPHIKIEQKIQELLDVDEPVCVVTSIADQKKGEKLIVLYTVDVDPAYIVHKLRDKSIPNLWIPSSDNFYKVEALPLLGTGKMDLAKVKQLAKGFLG
jgi:acyl-[acyl-carrier-protein]-phospholipid O-acyltransferase/long-chain-fatty-acid--[acyl-carrier-protein] ligase